MCWAAQNLRSPIVALLAEGVDRNMYTGCRLGELIASPSSRRAWIEIGENRRKKADWWSPSSRRAWIEMELRNWKKAAHASPSSRRAWIEIDQRWLEER